MFSTQIPSVLQLNAIYNRVNSRKAGATIDDTAARDALKTNYPVLAEYVANKNNLSDDTIIRFQLKDSTILATIRPEERSKVLNYTERYSPEKAQAALATKSPKSSPSNTLAVEEGGLKTEGGSLSVGLLATTTSNAVTTTTTSVVTESGAVGDDSLAYTIPENTTGLKPIVLQSKKYWLHLDTDAVFGRESFGYEGRMTRVGGKITIDTKTLPPQMKEFSFEAAQEAKRVREVKEREKFKEKERVTADLINSFTKSPFFDTKIQVTDVSSMREKGFRRLAFIGTDRKFWFYEKNTDDSGHEIYDIDTGDYIGFLLEGGEGKLNQKYPPTIE